MFRCYEYNAQRYNFEDGSFIKKRYTISQAHRFKGQKINHQQDQHVSPFRFSYSHKYSSTANMHQRQQIKIYRANDKKIEESPAANTNNPNIRPIVQLDSNRQEHQIKQIIVQQSPFPKTTTFDCSENIQDKNAVNAEIAASFKEHLQSVRSYYQAKIKSIVQDNAKSISELRYLLIHQQQKISEKQEEINRLIIIHQNKVAQGRGLPNRNQSPQKSKLKNANASYQYLNNKVRDMDISLKLLVDQFVESQDQIKDKIKNVQTQLICHFAQKLGGCWFKISKLIQKVQMKCNAIEKNMHQTSKNTEFNDNDMLNNKMLSQFQQKIDQFSQDIHNFQKKQYKYENERIQSLQHILAELLGKFGSLQNRNSLRGSRRANNNYGYFLQDEDQFFYPSSQRKVYQTNDEYEHFQSESDDDHSMLTKENISNNVQICVIEKNKKF